MTPSAALAALELLADGDARAGRASPRTLVRRRVGGSSGAVGLATATSAIRIASARSNGGGRRGGGSGARRGRRRPRRRGRDVLDEGRRRARGRRRCRGRRAPPGRSRGSSRSSPRRSRRARGASRSRRSLAPPSPGPSASSSTTSSRAGRRARERARQPLLGADEPLAHALAQLARGHARERHEQQLVERRALGDVARRERGDRVGLAGAGARLEHGDAASAAGRRRRTRGGVWRSAHRSVISSCDEQAVPQAPREAAEPRRLRVVPADPRLVRSRRLGQQLVERQHRRRGRAGARGRASSFVEVPARLPAVARPPSRRPPPRHARRRRPPTSSARDRQRLAHPAVAQVDEPVERCIARRAPRRPADARAVTRAPSRRRAARRR